MEGQTFTRRLSRAIDDAFETFTPGEPDSEAKLYATLLAQARNVVFHHLDANQVAVVARDIVHRAMMALVGFRGQSKLSTWFYRLAVNEVNRALKDRIVHRERFEPLVTREPDGEERELAIEAKPDNHNARIDLEQLCRRLSPDQAELISLKQHGYSLEEIGQKTNEPLGTIRSRYRLAKNKLRKPHKPMNQIGEVI